MDTASVLIKAANLLVGLRVLKWLAADLNTEMHHDAAILRDRATLLVQKSPYRAAGLAAVAGALTGVLLAHRR